jgi:hypothetical protein
MNNRGIILFSVGLLAVFLFYKKFGKKEEVLLEEVIENEEKDEFSLTCEEEWSKIALTLKATSDTAYQAQKDAFIAKCIANKKK